MTVRDDRIRQAIEESTGPTPEDMTVRLDRAALVAMEVRRYDLTPEEAVQITGNHPREIRQSAKQIGRAKVAAALQAGIEATE